MLVQRFPSKRSKETEGKPCNRLCIRCQEKAERAPEETEKERRGAKWWRGKCF